MTNLKKKITNPITVIAIFATLSETSAAITLPFLDNKEREVYVWFLISFPFYLLLLFFATLNFNYRSLYAPSDYKKGEHFIEVLDDMEHREVGATSPLEDRRFHTAPPLSEETGRPISSSVQQGIRLPESAKDLHIIDARGMCKKIELSALLQKPPKSQEKSACVIVFLADTESETLLKELAHKYSKPTRKRSNAAFFVVYNLHSKDMTVIDKTCH